ncbi:exodeoxyribonuclease V subunit beta [Colwelliaceae bacterium MEBiC 14330]
MSSNNIAMTAQHDKVAIELKNLDSATIKLSEKHLIEASAGTGKTYNITRIYLRLLLERKLTVEQILLMTFTKDATQELRGRIDAFIRLALSEWEVMCLEDSYFKQLDERIDKSEREFLLKRALLYLDEAAIFTIHGFCQRVLSQHAFSSGLPFNATMAANSSEIILQVCQDWYRSLAKTDEHNFKLLTDFWTTPQSFLSSFSKAIAHTSVLSVVDVNKIVEAFITLVKEARHCLQSNNDLLENALIIVKKGVEQDKRREELSQLLCWLDSIITKELAISELSDSQNKMPDSFFDGKRYARSRYKSDLLAAFEKVKKVKDQLKKINNKINKAKAYSIVKAGIYTIRQQVAEQKKALNLLDFDDLINTLSDCLTSKEQRADVLAKHLLTQYPVALIDEFQDTDPKQFAILQAIYFGDEAKKAQAGLFLIGDPKQAIYGFRGGDIFAYLNARHGCDHHWLMDTNWRSTAQMISAYNALFTHTQPVSSSESVFGYGIPYLPVLSGKAGQSVDSKPLPPQAEVDKALQFIHFTQAESVENKSFSQALRPALANWCALEISQLLSEYYDLDAAKATIKPKDIAILVRDGAEARDIKEALIKAGLDSVFLSDRANLFHSQQAKQLHLLLRGILYVENERFFIAAISCGLLGFDAQKLHQLQQDELAYQSLKFTFVDYRSQWQRQGFITMAINLMHNLLDVPEANKDRCLTNLLHLFEILQAATVRLSQGQALLYWFEQQCQADTNDVEAELRLESDADLIRIMTQHGSKGLEYPYVFIPFACRHKDPLKFGNKAISYLEYHDKQGNLCLSLDGSSQAKQAMSDESYAESIRLLYVAITRAERRCYILTCDFDNYHLSPLGRTLKLSEKSAIKSAIQAVKTSADHAIGIREIGLVDDNVSQLLSANSKNRFLAAAEQQYTTVAQFTGNIERNWWLSSFTALTRNIRHAGVSNPDRDTELTHLNFITVPNNDKICFKLIKGAQTGNLLHDILERTDFSQPNWQECMEQPLLKFGALMSSTSGSAKEYQQQDLINWLTEVVKAPFLPVPSSDTLQSLSDIALNKTLRESEFYFPMQGQGSEALTNLLTDHRNRAQRNDNANSLYPVMLPSHKKLSGMMHGFIDLIFQHQGKYYLCDYKSTHLGDNYQNYQFAALIDNVEKNYYDLQYLIYSLALHRYLKQTLIDYDAKIHFGGVYYLYLRGMTTEPKHQGSGIFYREINEAELNQLDSLFSQQSKKHHQAATIKANNEVG